MPTMTDTRPHNLEAEKAVLGSILLDNQVLGEIRKTLTVNDFFSRPHRLIFQAILDLADEKHEINLISLTDQLTREKLLDLASGPVYVSCLTDGVAIGTSSGISEYCRIVKEHAESRALINMADSVTARVQLGKESPAQIMEEVRAEMEAAKPAKPAAAVPKKKGRDAYPHFPEDAWYGISQGYRLAMAKTSEASDNFHLATFLTAAGAMLGKTVAYGTDEDNYIYPNLFTLLIGDSGEGKDQASKRGLAWLRRNRPSVFVVNHVSSAETLIDEMADAKKKREETADHTPLRTFLYLSELRDLIEKAKQKGAGTIVSKLCQAFDVPPELNARTRGQPTGFVRNAIVTLQASTNPDWMNDLDLKDLKGGLGSRVMFVPGNAKPPDRRWQAPDPSWVKKLDDRLQSVEIAYPVNLTRRFEITPDGEEFLDRWYLRSKTLTGEDPLIKFLAVRDIVHVYKIALIHAALEMAGQIEKKHLVAAMAFVDFLRDVRPVIFEGHGFSPTQVAQATAERIIRDREKISYSEALNLFKRQGDSMLFKRIIDSLCVPGGPVERQLSGSSKHPKQFLVWRGEG